jgi:hypothetical protein
VVPSDFRLFGKRFADDEEVEMEAQKWLRQQSKNYWVFGHFPLFGIQENRRHISEMSVEHDRSNGKQGIISQRTLCTEEASCEAKMKTKNIVFRH